MGRIELTFYRKTSAGFEPQNSIHIERAWLNWTLWVYAQLGHFRKGKNIFVFQNSLTYSADVKPTVNKNQFDFVYCLHLRMLSLFEYYDLYDFNTSSMLTTTTTAPFSTSMFDSFDDGVILSAKQIKAFDFSRPRWKAVLNIPKLFWLYLPTYVTLRWSGKNDTLLFEWFGAQQKPDSRLDDWGAQQNSHSRFSVKVIITIFRFYSNELLKLCTHLLKL